jgi:hypothetical protein
MFLMRMITEGKGVAFFPLPKGSEGKDCGKTTPQRKELNRLKLTMIWD